MVKQPESLDYGDGFTYRLCGCDPQRVCGLGDLIYPDGTIVYSITQREAVSLRAATLTAPASAQDLKNSRRLGSLMV